ncbi:hypothetical protein MMC16_006292 [Acarospora aff. strigata]|nr:hypothetical protein [Acarospora aff. strigata]
MEVSTLPTASTASMDLTTSSITFQTDLDVDMDIDLGPPEPLSEAIDADVAIEITQTEGMLAILSDSNVDQLVPHKVHLRGVDDLKTSDIRNFAVQHFPSDPPTRVEWIDDTSANLVYNTPASALEALAKFSSTSGFDPSVLPSVQLRPARSFTSHPDAALQVRIAMFSDQKKPRAYEASRFYLMHPELDPRERKRRQERTRRTYGDDHGDYRKRRYDRGEQRRRRQGDGEGTFDASMYDDDRGTLTAREQGRSARQDSFSSYSSQDDHRRNGHRHVRYGRSSSRSRDRSASPVREVEHEENSKRNADRARRGGRRDRTPFARVRSSASSSMDRTNGGRELFPHKALSTVDSSAGYRGSGSMISGRELFPNKTAATSLKKSLFPNKTGTSNHRRSDAFDAADETASLFANGMSVPFTDGTLDNSPPTLNLEDKTTKASDIAYGRLKDSESTPSAGTSVAVGSEGFNIRGVAQKQDQGFSIRGAAGYSATNKDIKELFPGKYGGNSGKELFSEKLEGRGGRRRKAEDMFY